MFDRGRAAYQIRPLPYQKNQCRAQPVRHQRHRWLGDGAALSLTLATGTAGQPGYVVAPVQLPQGATITSLSITAFDNDGTSEAPQAVLAATSAIGAGNVVNVLYLEQVVLAAESSDWQTITKASSHVVRNDLYVYNLRVRLAQNAFNTRLCCVRIGYTVSQPD